MKQIFLEHVRNVMYGGPTTLYWPGYGCGYLLVSSAPLNGSIRRLVSAAGTLRNFVVLRQDGLPSSLTITVMKNGLATSLEVVLTSGALSGSDIVNTVSLAVGDDICLRFAGSAVGLGHDLGYSLEFETSGNVSTYTHDIVSGTMVAGDAKYCGILGNGQPVSYVNPVRSNTYSIAAAAGNITRIDATAWSGAPGTGVWTITLIKNLVLQDGSGGTVNTSFTITGAATTGFSTFVLPVVAGDILEIHVKRTVSTASFNVAHVGCSIAFTSAVADYHMIVGGNNNVISILLNNFHWCATDQLVTDETRAMVPIGPTSLRATGLYIERSAGPAYQAPGASYNHILRKNAADTSIAVLMTNNNAGIASGLITGQNVEYVSGDTIDLETVPSGSPQTSQLHWGLSVFTGTPAVTVTSGPGVGLYFIDPGKTNDSLYTTISGPSGLAPTTVESTVKKIPNPFVVLS